MANAVIMPRQGQSVESCILTEWYKSPGDQVSKGDLLFAYETDKAAFEEEAPEDGVLLACFFEEGDEVPVLVNVAVIGATDEDVEAFRPDGDSPGSADDARDTAASEGAEPLKETDKDSASETIVIQDVGSNGAHISPRARRLAKEKRVVLETVRGSGPGGRIIERDVLEAIGRAKGLLRWPRRKRRPKG